MTVHANVSGTFKNVPRISVHVSGSWYRVSEGYTRFAGTWRRLFLHHVIDLTAEADGGGNPFGFGLGEVLGSVNPPTYLGLDGTEYTLRSIAWFHSASQWAFNVNGAHADSDAVFKSMVVNGVEFFRADRDLFDQPGGTNTRWRWQLGPGDSPIAPTGSYDVDILF
jgi:hypothetical protein